MNIKLIIALICIVAVIAFLGTQLKIDNQTNTNTPEQACTSSGGNVTTSLCCASVSDFPNTCLIGACGCSPTSSHQIKICDCQPGKCFNGTACE